MVWFQNDFTKIILLPLKIEKPLNDISSQANGPISN